ncbi:Uncharacterised protein [uncultured archaeon]|nr:Uncharacterised protein [uncultured archaeon]
MRGYIYFGTVKIELLEKFMKEFFCEDEIFYIKETIDSYKLSPKLEISIKGRAFSNKGEVRWEEKEGAYNTLILTEDKLENIPAGISEVNDNWIVEHDMKFHLVPLQMGHISPNFKEYPNGAEYIRASIYKRNGISSFISPRRFEK